MDTIRKLEDTVAGWYKAVPHLPAEVRKWLAENMWWITLVGVVIGGFGIISTLFLTLLAGAFLTSVGGGFGAMAGLAIFIGVLASIILGAVAVVISALAIKPLKVMKKKGWTLLFIVLLLEVASIVVSNLLGFNLFGLVWGILWAAVAGYFLFELRSEYGIAVTPRKKVVATQK